MELTMMQTAATPVLTLKARIAAELMTTNPLSISEKATVQEALAFLVDKGFSAAPVIDDAGHPVGVLSRADLLVHARASSGKRAVPDYYARPDLALDSGEVLEGFQVESTDSTEVRDIMTPVVFSVSPNATAERVVKDMVAWKVHRLFVVDASNVLVGVISALDVLRKLS
jgi:CBS domain-containing protein